MELRRRLHRAIEAEIAAILPQAGETAWDGGGVTLVIDEMRFSPRGGHEGDWAWCADCDGRLRLDLIGDELDSLPVEPLIVRLIERPPTLAARGGRRAGRDHPQGPRHARRAARPSDSNAGGLDPDLRSLRRNPAPRSRAETPGPDGRRGAARRTRPCG